VSIDDRAPFIRKKVFSGGRGDCLDSSVRAVGGGCRGEKEGVARRKPPEEKI